MKYHEFHLGCEFKTGSEKTFRCTDIGKRVIIAIGISGYPDDTSWYNGPPYAVEEHVFDEDSQEDCTLI